MRSLMVKKLAVLCSLAIAAGLAAPASAQYQWFENFENGLAGWNLWTQRGANQSAAAIENPDLGDIQPWSGGNNTMAFVGGDNFNGGIWQVITLPLGAGTYEIDGFWRSNVQPNSAWAEVIVVEGNNPPVDGQDTTGPLHYKHDSWTSPSWDGQISLNAPVANIPSFTTAGTITLILKTGNVGGVSGTNFDDVWITPEPATAALLVLGALPLLRRRRRA